MPCVPRSTEPSDPGMHWTHPPSVAWRTLHPLCPVKNITIVGQPLRIRLPEKLQALIEEDYDVGPGPADGERVAP